MPNFKKRFTKFMDRALLRPEYFRFLRANATGYRSREEAVLEFHRVRGWPGTTNYLALDNAAMERAIKVYGRAGRTALDFLIIGRKTNNFTDVNYSTEEYPYIDADMFDNFGGLNETIKPFGSIMSSPNWSFFMNDMMIYGGISNRQSFYLASRRDMDVLWDPSKPHPSIFARELIGLFVAGYELHQLIDESEIMVPPEQALDFSLTKYMSSLPYFMTKENVRLMTQPNLRGIRYDPMTNRLHSYTEFD